MTPADRVLGRYELLGILGTGGMATVYLGIATGEAGFHRLFAIKVLHRHLMAEPQFIEMFLDEARIAATLRHPNVVPIVDLGTHDGAYYVAMEYVEGCSLATLLRKHRKARPPRLLVPLMLDALAGLEAAHAAVDAAGQPMQLVHRDVSPQNILIGIDGTARLTDFGIARANARVSTTEPGHIKGKYSYMSPEQFRNSADLDRRADVFSAGSVLWSMLTARCLFQADSDAATIYNIIKLEVPLPSTIGLRPPTAFDAVCLRALAREPDDRFATAQAMEEALRDAALRAGGLASRREVGAWVLEAVAAELAATREAIRIAATSPRRPGGELAAIRAVHDAAKVTSTSGDALAPIPAPVSTGSGVQPGLVEASDPGAPATGAARPPPDRAARRRVAVAAGGVLGAIIVGVVAALAMGRAPADAELPPTPAPRARAAPAAAPLPTVSAPAQTRPAAPHAGAAPSKPAAPLPAPAPAGVAPMLARPVEIAPAPRAASAAPPRPRPAASAPARPPPPPPRHRPAAPVASAPSPPAEPPPVAAEPAPAKTWDNDSPVPPP